MSVREFLGNHIWWVVAVWLLVSILMFLSIASLLRDRRQLVWEGRPLVNIRDFGAKGDGNADDTQAISRALGVIPNGGTVYFPPGVYKLAAKVEVADARGTPSIMTMDRNTELSIASQPK